MKSDQRKDPSLPEAAEALLSDWPSTEREPEYWQEQARTVDKRLSETEIGSTNSSMLEPPLPLQAGERSGDESTSDIKLADLARAVAHKKSEDLHDIAKQSLSLASRSRAAAVKHSVSKAQVGETRQVGPDSSDSSREQVLSDSAAKTPGKAGTASTAGPTRDRSVRTQSLIGVTVGVLGVAAAVGMYISTTAHRGPEQLHTSPQAAPPRSIATEEASRSLDTLEQPPKVKPNESKQKADTSGRTPIADPQPKALAPEPHTALSASPPEGASATDPRFAPPIETVHLREETEPTERATAPEKPVAAKGTPAARPPSDSLPNAGEPKLRPADGTAGPTADKPSFGAATAALGAVMPAARACVAGQRENIPATVIFGSDGRVTSVSVGGNPDAATRSCISTALKRARLQPFARPTFSISVSVRPR